MRRRMCLSRAAGRQTAGARRGRRRRHGHERDEGRPSNRAGDEAGAVTQTRPRKTDERERGDSIAIQYTQHETADWQHSTAHLQIARYLNYLFIRVLYFNI